MEGVLSHFNDEDKRGHDGCFFNAKDEFYETYVRIVFVAIRKFHLMYPTIEV